VVDAIERMVEDRLMLCEDVDDEVTRLIQLGVDLGVPPPEGGWRRPSSCRANAASMTRARAPPAGLICRESAAGAAGLRVPLPAVLLAPAAAPVPLALQVVVHHRQHGLGVVDPLGFLAEG